ncbi:MAG: cyclase family protein [Acidimicrobiales bacterium]
MADEGLPTYDELPEVPGLGMRHAWDVWGRDDVLGSINLVTATRVAAARGEIVTGARYSLDLPLDVPNPPLYGRRPYRHHVRPLNRHEMDDHLDDFHPQGSTQWDALGHVRCREHGYWGGRTQDPTEGPNGLGIHHWARHGIAGRGILLDVAARLAADDPGYDPLEPRPITVEDLQATLDAQRVTPGVGDLWCVRTGWVTAYRALGSDARAAYAIEPRFAGLQADEAMARFLWNAHPAALVCDNPAVERAPGDPAVGSLHRRLLPLLGFALGEMFDLDALAAACAADERWTFLFVAAPLHVPDGLGSPGNAMAIR